MMYFFSIEYALLSMQSALLGEVTPSLRAVIIDLDTEEHIFHACIYYDGEASEKMIDLWDCVICEASAHLGLDCFVKSQVQRLDYPKEIPPGGYCAYMRRHEVGVFSEVCIKEMSIGYALLAVQKALLGVVTPELRSVIVDLNENVLYIRFFYDRKAATDLWPSAISSVKMDCVVDYQAERVDYPNPLPFRGRYAYLRKESI